MKGTKEALGKGAWPWLGLQCLSRLVVTNPSLGEAQKDGKALP